MVHILFRTFSDAYDWRTVHTSLRQKEWFYQITNTGSQRSKSLNNVWIPFSGCFCVLREGQCESPAHSWGDGLWTVIDSHKHCGERGSRVPQRKACCCKRRAGGRRSRTGGLKKKNSHSRTVIFFPLFCVILKTLYNCDVNGLKYCK